MMLRPAMLQAISECATLFEKEGSPHSLRAIDSLRLFAAVVGDLPFEAFATEDRGCGGCHRCDGGKKCGKSCRGKCNKRCCTLFGACSGCWKYHRSGAVPLNAIAVHKSVVHVRMLGGGLYFKTTTARVGSDIVRCDALIVLLLLVARELAGLAKCRAKNLDSAAAAAAVHLLSERQSTLLQLVQIQINYRHMQG